MDVRLVSPCEPQKGGAHGGPTPRGILFIGDEPVLEVPLGQDPGPMDPGIWVRGWQPRTCFRGMGDHLV